MTRISLIVVAFSFASLNGSFSQCFWAKKFGSYQATDVIVDNVGNVYTCGAFNSIADFNPGSGTFNMAPQGNGDVFVSKFDANGNFIWAKQIGGVDGEGASSITLDASGNLLLTGNFQGTVDFDPSTGIANLTASGYRDGFICKLTSNGDFVWVRKFGGAAYPTYVTPSSITRDSQNNILVTGDFAGTVDFNPGISVFNITSIFQTINQSNPEVFILKLDSNGNFIWAKSVECIGYDEGRAVTTDISDNVLITGFFRLTGDFDPGPGNYSMTANNVEDAIFVLKLDAGGNFVWAVQMSNGISNNRGWDISSDDFGNIFTTGQYTGTIDIDPGPSVYNLSPQACPNCSGGFILKLDPLGNFISAINCGTVGYGIDVSSDNKIYCTGWLSNTQDFDPSPNAFNLSPGGTIFPATDMFIASYDNDLNFIYAHQTVGSSTMNTSSIVTPGYGALSVDNNGYAHIAGYFGGPAIDFDPGPTIFNMIGATGGQPFVYKLFAGANPSILTDGPTTICQGEAVVLTSSSATGNLWSNGATTQSITVTQSGNYSVSVTNATCTETSTTTAVAVNVAPVTPIVSASGPTTFCDEGAVLLTSTTGAGLTYQWKNNGIDIVGATTSTYTATSSGTYTITSTNNNNCSSNSNSIVVTINDSPIVDAGGDLSICENDSITLTAIGADTYQWSNGIANGTYFSPTQSAEYVVVGTNLQTGCSNVDSVLVTVNSSPLIDAGQDITVCQGDTIILSGNGAETYNWNNNVIDSEAFVPLLTQTYQVVGTDLNGCSNTDQLVVTVLANSSSILNETGIDSYMLNGQTYTQSGTYTQVIPNSVGCDSTITLILTLDFTGLNEYNQSQISLFPNPAQDFMIVKSNQNLIGKAYQITDNAGRVVLSGEIISEQMSIDLAFLCSGIYTFNLMSDSVRSFKLIKN